MRIRFLHSSKHCCSRRLPRMLASCTAIVLSTTYPMRKFVTLVMNVIYQIIEYIYFSNSDFWNALCVWLCDIYTHSIFICDSYLQWGDKFVIVALTFCDYEIYSSRQQTCRSCNFGFYVLVAAVCKRVCPFIIYQSTGLARIGLLSVANPYYFSLMCVFNKCWNCLVMKRVPVVCTWVPGSLLSGCSHNSHKSHILRKRKHFKLLGVSVQKILIRSQCTENFNCRLEMTYTSEQDTTDVINRNSEPLCPVWWVNRMWNIYWRTVLS